MGSQINHHFPVRSSHWIWQGSGCPVAELGILQWGRFICSSNVNSRWLCLPPKAPNRWWHLLIFQTTSILLKQYFNDTSSTRCQHLLWALALVAKSCIKNIVLSLPRHAEKERLLDNSKIDYDTCRKDLLDLIIKIHTNTSNKRCNFGLAFCALI